MAERLRVVVEQDDIDRGVPGDAECCPVARAIRRLRPGADVSVAFDLIYVGGLFGEPDADIASWIKTFDWSRESAHPFGFVLELEAAS